MDKMKRTHSDSLFELVPSDDFGLKKWHYWIIIAIFWNKEWCKQEDPEKAEVKMHTSGLAEETATNAATKKERRTILFMVEGCGEFSRENERSDWPLTRIVYTSSR